MQNTQLQKPSLNNVPGHIRAVLSLLVPRLHRAGMSGYHSQLCPTAKAKALSGGLGFPNSSLLLGHPAWVAGVSGRPGQALWRNLSPKLVGSSFYLNV